MKSKILEKLESYNPEYKIKAGRKFGGEASLSRTYSVRRRREEKRKI